MKITPQFQRAQSHYTWLTCGFLNNVSPKTYISIVKDATDLSPSVISISSGNTSRRELVAFCCL